MRPPRNGYWLPCSRCCSSSSCLQQKGKLPPTRSMPTSGEVTGLALTGRALCTGSGPMGAVPVRSRRSVLSGRGSVIHRRGGGASFAVATNRAAWIARGGSPSETDEYLLTTPLPRLHLRQVASAVRFDDHEAQSEVGNWLSGLAGSGNVIAVSSWTTASAQQLVEWAPEPGSAVPTHPDRLRLASHRAPVGRCRPHRGRPLDGALAEPLSVERRGRHRRR